MPETITKAQLKSVILQKYNQFLNRQTKEKAMATCKSVRAFCIAIDGRCGSGKTTLAARLKHQLEAVNIPVQIIHMDDFYLQQHQRTEERLNEPGGNVDYERFQTEVLHPATQGKQFSYQPYFHPERSFKDPVPICNQGILIIEGTYSQNPVFQDPYDLTIFTDLTPSLQQKRILQRSSQDKLEEFNRLWIPKEELYFTTLHPERKADLYILETEEEGK